MADPIYEKIDDIMYRVTETKEETTVMEYNINDLNADITRLQAEVDKLNALKTEFLQL